MENQTFLFLYVATRPLHVVTLHRLTWASSRLTTPRQLNFLHGRQLRIPAQVIQSARPRLPDISNVASEVTQHHLYHILLITRESHMPIEGRDIDPTS